MRQDNLAKGDNIRYSPSCLVDILYHIRRVAARAEKLVVDAFGTRILIGVTASRVK